jgi:hypothetical protein
MLQTALSQPRNVIAHVIKLEYSLSLINKDSRGLGCPRLLGLKPAWFVILIPQAKWPHGLWHGTAGEGLLLRKQVFCTVT